MSTPIKLTQASVKALPLVQPEDRKRQHLYFDSTLPGFGLVVGAKAKTFVVQRDIDGRSVRTSIGRYGVYTVDQAREEAKELLRDMAKGVNPNRRETVTAPITYGEALESHLNSNRSHSGRTEGDYRYLSAQYIPDWLTRPLIGITRRECRERHQRIGENHGTYVANKTFRVFRAAYNHAMKVHEELGVCPTIAVDWFPEERRKAAIPSASLGDWYAEIMSLQNPIRRDYLRLVLFTGLRRNDAATMRWEHIGWDTRTALIPTPKGGKPFHLPLSGFLLQLLTARRGCPLTADLYPDSPWVFPASSRSGHISEPKEKLGVRFSVHGLRNTFITVAESQDISPYAIKMLVNHSLPDKRDVTAGYISLEVERLREPMEKISKKLLKLCNADTG